MKTIVTLKRFYFKEVEIEVDNKLLRGMELEQISTYLMEEYPYDEEDEEFDKAELQDLEIDYKGRIYEDTNRFDIYEDGKPVYGDLLDKRRK